MARNHSPLVKARKNNIYCAYKYIERRRPVYESITVTYAGAV